MDHMLDIKQSKEPPLSQGGGLHSKCALVCYHKVHDFVLLFIYVFCFSSLNKCMCHAVTELSLPDFSDMLKLHLSALLKFLIITGFLITLDLLFTRGLQGAS